MRIDTGELGRVRVLTCTGRLVRDSGDEDLVRACDAVLAIGAYVVLDLHEVSWLDSSGVGAIVSCAKHAGERGAVIKIVLPPEGPARRVFLICQLDRALETFPDAASAAASFS